MRTPRPRQSEWLLECLLALGVAAAYLAAAKLGLALAVHAPQVSAVWPPTGVALAAVLRRPRAGVAGVLLGAFAANATTPGEPLAVALGIAIGNTLEAVVGAALLRRAGFQLGLARVHDVLALLVAAAASPVVSATIGVASLGAGGVQPVSELPLLWRVWWLGDALGDLVVAPLLLLGGGAAARSWNRRSAAEAATLAAGLAAASAVFRSSTPAAVTEYAVFPLLIWGALRFGPAGAAAATAAIYAAAVWGTVSGLGPFAGAAEPGLVPLQLFMAAAAATGLLLAAAAAQQSAAQDSAERSERRLLVALQAASMGVWEWTIATGEVRWSEGLEPVHGLSAGGFAGTLEAFLALVHAEDRARVERAIREAVATGSPYRAEFRSVAPDGSVRWIAAHGRLQPGGRGSPARMLGVGLDVTEAKRLEEQLLRQAERLADADRRKDEFLAMLAHELRNPLAPILHATELLGPHASPELVAAAREMIRRQTEHLRRIVDDLLEVARATRGAIGLECRRTTLA
ncbi:MAG TPA: MASE1 domain-containing protein, partial [Thermoanaerobaculia bacterium]|nr:MASE1 domain-containing protein [Thermoanaerobaculia bacterium]